MRKRQAWIDPLRGVACFPGEPSRTEVWESPFADGKPRLVRINPRTVDRKRKAKDRAHRKAVKRQKALARRAGR